MNTIIKQLPLLAANLTLMGGLLNPYIAQGEDTYESPIEEVTVWGRKHPALNTSESNPLVTLTPEDLVSVNAMTTEDLVTYEPSIVIRQRYIGDANGTMGMRGSNMFQTSRSMVFADGVPLHYLLQTRWSGAPRWSLVSADEISEIKIIYGPFSAEYGGNAMGGVVNIETVIPIERKFHMQVSGFQQQFDDLGFDGKLGGDKVFVSYADKFDKTSLYASFNRLENVSQPMSFQFTQTSTPVGLEETVTGAVSDTNEYDAPVLYFADAGETESVSDQFKVKLGYEIDSWLAVMNIAYEDRTMDQDKVNNYLRNASGDAVWNGDVVQDAQMFTIASDDFTISQRHRRSLLMGGRVQGQIGESWWMEAGISRFDILKDESSESDANPADPAFTLAGGVSDYKDTGWKTVAIKFYTDQLLGLPNLDLATGYQHEEYSLGIYNYSSNDFTSGAKTDLAVASGGESKLNALFAQAGWQLSGQWDMQLGVRYENWETNDGFYYNYSASNLQDHIDRSASELSPKFSVGYTSGNISVRYSLAKASRFPIVEELFQNERRTTGTSIANANLEAESGLHHNLMFNHELNAGDMRVNFFFETIDDVIFAQTAIVDGKRLNTFIPIDEVETQGIEVIFNQRNLLHDSVDLRLNIAFVHSEIIKNLPNTLLEGKTFPRMPKRRANLLVTWHVTELLDIGAGIRYAANSYGDLNNADIGSNVYGTQDGYTLINFKSSYQANQYLKISFGVNNITNEITYVHHPWPGRTAFMEASVDF